MTPGQKQELTRFYQNCKDMPLEPSDPRYEPYLEGALHDPIGELTSQIMLNPAAGVHLLTGRIGSGKSTELRRLKYLLEQEGCIVFLSDMRNYLHQDSPVGIVDFLISLMTGLTEAFEARYGEEVVVGSFWERFKGFLPEIEAKEITLKAKVADVKLTLRDDPSFKERLKERSEIQKLVQETQQFTSTLARQARTLEGDSEIKVVLLVDSFELRGRGEDGANYRSVQELFTTHGDRLRLPSIDVVYTAPQYLFFLVKGLSTRFGSGPVCNLPCIHVQHPPGRGSETPGCPNEGGVAILKRILERRYGAWGTFFTEDQVLRLIQASGGDIREFLLLVGNSLVKLRASTQPALPMPDPMLESVLDDMRRGYLPIPDDQKAWMAKIHEDQQPHLDTENQIWPFVQMLDQKLVINYRNGDDWYDIHPLLHRLFQKDLPSWDRSGS